MFWIFGRDQRRGSDTVVKSAGGLFLLFSLERTKKNVEGTGYRVRGTGYRVQGKSRVQGIWYSRSMFWIFGRDQRRGSDTIVKSASGLFLLFWLQRRRYKVENTGYRVQGRGTVYSVQGNSRVQGTG